MRLDAFDARRNQGRGLRRVAVLALVVATLGAGYVLTRTSGLPEVEIKLGLPAVGPKTPLLVSAEATGRGLEGLRVQVRQGEQVKVLHESKFVAPSPWKFWSKGTENTSIELQLTKAEIPDLRAKKLILEVEAVGAGTPVLAAPTRTATKAYTLRLRPPRIAVLSQNIFAAQGGSEVVVYSVGPTAVRHGVKAGPYFFPGYPLPDGDYFSLFAVPYDLDDEAQVRLYAEDDVGNTVKSPFLDRFIKRPFKRDTINVTDRFMEIVVPRILAKTPELEDRGELLKNYIAINSELREKNAELLRSLAKKTQERFLWNKSFVQMPAKVVSAFADRRTYLYKGKEIDKQDHLGFDLASVRRAKIPSANAGTVVFADYLGIYGNAVVVDHGYGLQSLYAHMSKFSVKAGDIVTRGQTLGRTGATGLALGDHLHFTLMLQGLPITPLEWWDGHWIRDRLGLKLGEVLNFQAKGGRK